jgi:hypothetical protein
MGGNDLPMVDASAARGADGRLYLALVNLDPHRPTHVTTALTGTATGRILTGPAMDSHNTFDARVRSSGSVCGEESGPQTELRSSRPLGGGRGGSLSKSAGASGEVRAIMLGVCAHRDISHNYHEWPFGGAGLGHDDRRCALRRTTWKATSCEPNKPQAIQRSVGCSQQQTRGTNHSVSRRVSYWMKCDTKERASSRKQPPTTRCHH